MVLFFCCSSNNENESQTSIEEEEELVVGNGTASIVDVTLSGEENQYNFNVTISSDETGCNQYADWWEVLSTNENLIYRRILAHSHINEQPFTRSGGPIPISSTTEVYVRAHMNYSGYGTKVFKGTADRGFSTANLSADFAEDLQTQEPLPEGCAF